MAKNKKNSFKAMKTWKKVLVIGLAVITLIGAIAGISALFREDDKTTKTINPAFSVGGLTENGAYLDTQESIYTKNAFECQGLDIELAFDNNISYKVYFYNQSNDFLSATEKQTKNYDEILTPYEAKTARIVITPNEDNKISWYEINGYANQLKISVNKEQKDIKLPYQGKDLMVYRPNVSIGYSGGVNGFQLNDGGTYNATELVSTLGKSNVCIKANADLLDDVSIRFMGTDAYIKGGALSSIAFDVVELGGFVYLTTEVPTDCVAIFISSPSDVNISNFGIYVW